MNTRTAILAAISLTFVIGACQQNTTPAKKTGATSQLSAGKTAKPASAPAKKKVAPKPPAAEAAPLNPALLDPSKLADKAPETFAVKLETTKGDIIIDVTRAWAPLGADRFYNLVKGGFYNNDVAVFRVISGFMAQFGIHGNPKVAAVWRNARINDEPVKGSNTAGMVTYAKGGPNSRTTQIFINFGNNKRLDSMGFAPFGKVRDMAVMNSIYSGYGEGAPRGRGPDQGMLQQRGNEYLKERFPEMDYIKRASIIK